MKNLPKLLLNIFIRFKSHNIYLFVRIPFFIMNTKLVLVLLILFTYALWYMDYYILDTRYTSLTVKWKIHTRAYSFHFSDCLSWLLFVDVLAYDVRFWFYRCQRKKKVWEIDEVCMRKTAKHNIIYHCWWF